MKKILSILTACLFISCSDVNVKNTPLDVNVKNEKPIKVELNSSSSAKRHFTYLVKKNLNHDNGRYFQMPLIKGGNLILTYTDADRIVYSSNDNSDPADTEFSPSILTTNELVLREGGSVTFYASANKQTIYVCGYLD